MKNAIIIYHSKTGTTKKMAMEIRDLLETKGMSTQVYSMEQCRSRDLSGFDYVFLGCWTKGLMFFAQHPDPSWKQFAGSLIISPGSCITLFSTYKIAIGSMFRKMRKSLNTGCRENIHEIRSKDGHLSPEDAESLDKLLQDQSPADIIAA